MSLFFNTFAILLTFGIGGLYLFGIEHGLFWNTNWYDIVLHSLGGLLMGAWACAVSARLSFSPRGAALFVFVVATAGGISWEVFEYTLSIWNGPVDTAFDLLFDLLGAFSALLFYVPLYKRFRI